MHYTCKQYRLWTDAEKHKLISWPSSIQFHWQTSLRAWLAGSIRHSLVMCAGRWFDSCIPLTPYACPYSLQAMLKAAQAITLPTTGQPLDMRVGMHRCAYVIYQHCNEICTYKLPRLLRMKVI